MFQLLNPIWLFGIGGILIPLIIHLWNIKKGRTLKIGSVILLGVSLRQNARSLRLENLLLLLLRCLLLIILALLLAEPVWTSRNRPTQNKGWILIEKENFQETYTRFKAEIDSLDRIGYEFHFFDPGFKPADMEDLVKDAPLSDTTSTQLSYWSLVRMLDHEIPTGTKAFIFTPNRLSRFKGERPVISSHLSWKIYTASDSTATSIHSAYFSAKDSIRASISTSGPDGAHYRLENIDPADRNSPYALDIQNGKASLSFKASSSPNTENKRVNIDTATLRIAIYTDKFQNDAGYLKAAIGAIQKYTARKIKLTSFSSEQIPPQQSLIFWLSEKKLSGVQLKSMKPGTSLFIYEEGKAESINSWLDHSPAQISVQKEPISLYRRIKYPEQEMNRFSIWEDGFGRPVLDLRQEDQVSVYHFYSRFNPEWNDLVWNDDFAKMLIPVILPDLKATETEQYDRRTADQAQIIPALTYPGSGSKERSLQKDEQLDLKHSFWLALIIVFLCERWLSFRQDQI